MKDFVSPKIKEARKAMVRLKFFMVLLDTIAVYIFFAILLTLAGWNVHLAAIPSMLYLLVKWGLVLRDDRTMARITSRYPGLDERLQTAYDNREQSNLIVQRLVTDVSRKLDDIYSSAFFEKRAAALRIFTIVFLLFGLLSINFINAYQIGLDFQKNVLRKAGLVTDSGDGSNANGSESMSNGLDKNGESSKRFTNPEEKKKLPGSGVGNKPGYKPVGSGAPMPGGGAATSSNSQLYGDAAPPGTAKAAPYQEGRMEIHPEYGGGIDVKTIGGADSSNTYQTPDQVESAGTSADQDPVQYEEVIRNYWGKMIQTQEGGK